MHNIQHAILSKLATVESARFSKIKPANTETNLYSYHLNTLMRQGYVQKAEGVYKLTAAGLAYADRMSKDKVSLRVQPKIITMTVLINERNAVYLYPKLKQPFIGRWNLPSGKLHMDDSDVGSAAKREIQEKLGVVLDDVVHVGDAYIRVRSGQDLISTVFAHIFAQRVKVADVATDFGVWMSSDDRKEAQLAPAINEIIDSTLSAKSRFFEEYDIDWEI